MKGAAGGAVSKYLPAHLRVQGASRFAAQASQLKALEASHFIVSAGTDGTFDFSMHLAVVKEALSAFHFGRFLGEYVTSDSACVDTAGLALRDLDLGARLVAVFHSITLLQPESRAVEFAQITADEETGVTVVANERYSSRLAPNSQQTVVFQLVDGTVIRGQTSKTVGRKSEVEVTDGDKTLLLTGNVVNITVHGRDDADASQLAALSFWFHVIRLRATSDVTAMRAMDDALDPSALFYPLFYGEAPLTKGPNRTIRKYGPLDEASRYTTIERSNLDPAQRTAAMALLRPIKDFADRLTVIHGPPGTGKTTVIREVCLQWTTWVRAQRGSAASIDTVSSEPSGSKGGAKVTAAASSTALGQKSKGASTKGGSSSTKKASRGTVPTSMDENEEEVDEESAAKAAAKARKQTIQPQEVIPSMWCVCQSNAAVKNIAESMKRSGVEFRILVSDSFYTEWHEDMYTKFHSEVLISTGLKEDLDIVRQWLGACPVILCTVSSLSSRRLELGRIFELRPMYNLIVDEASQIVMASYPHVLARHAKTLARVAFFGDHLQLAPFGHDSIPEIESIFELQHLQQRAIMLNRCYRLPTGLADFISREVYDGKLQHAGIRQALEDSVRFFDIADGRENKGDPSYTNVIEAEAVRDFVEQHLADTHGDNAAVTTDFRVLTPYTGQRDLIERTLKDNLLPWEDRVFTIDSFQGQEADTILISLVRDGLPIEGHTAGFLTNQRRTNVLLSRSKRETYIFTRQDFVCGPNAKGRDTLVGHLADAIGPAAWRTADDLSRGKGLLGKR